MPQDDVGTQVESREAAAPDPDADCQPRTTPLPETTPLSETAATENEAAASPGQFVRRSTRKRQPVNRLIFDNNTF